MASGSSAVPTYEAQRIMMLSVDKIVSSRSRRGGVSLHRNLLVAGVLFRARDALLAAKTVTVCTSVNSEIATSVRSPGNANLVEQQSSPFISSTTSTSKSTAQSTECCGYLSTPTPQATTPQEETCRANDEVPVVGSKSCSKENVPPLPSLSPKFDSLNSCADLSARKPSRKRSYPTSISPPNTVDHTERNLVTGTKSSEKGNLSRKRWVSCKLNKMTAPTSFSSAPGQQASDKWSAVNAGHVPVVYVNQVELNAGVCHTPAIGCTSSPHCGPSAGLGITNLRPACVVQVV